MAPVSDLTRLSKLDVETSADSKTTKHVLYTARPGQRKVRNEEQWKRQQELGNGYNGAVYLEQCIEGVNEGMVRAVKEIQKSNQSYYHRELEAIALFSHSKVSPGPARGHRILLMASTTSMRITL